METNARGADAAIATHGLTRRFGDLVAVDDLTVEIPSRSVTGLVGPNGSGKSTTIRMLLGLLSPTAGSATVLGESIERPNTYCDAVGALVENPALVPGLSGRANLRSAARLRGVTAKRVDEVLEIVDLAEHANRRVRTYSLGMKQRLGIAMALLADPQLLVLDEPTNGLDPTGVVEIRNLVRRLADEGGTVLVSSHLLGEIQAAADHLVVIRSGRLLYSGALAGLLAEERMHVDIATADPNDAPLLLTHLRDVGFAAHRDNGSLRVLADPSQAAAINSTAFDLGIVLARIEPHSESLEDVFLRMTESESQ